MDGNIGSDNVPQWAPGRGHCTFATLNPNPVEVTISFADELVIGVGNGASNNMDTWNWLLFDVTGAVSGAGASGISDFSSTATYGIGGQFVCNNAALGSGGWTTVTAQTVTYTMTFPDDSLLLMQDAKNEDYTNKWKYVCSTTPP